MRTNPLRRRGGSRHSARAAAALVTAAVLLAAGCSSAENRQGQASSGGTEPLTDAQAEQALLTAENLGGDYRQTADDGSDDDDLTGMGCLSALGELEEADADAQAETDYEFDGELGVPAVYSAVSSYARTSDLVDALDKFRTAMEGCSRIEDTDDEGNTITLDLTLDEEKTTTDVDDQINFAGTGTIASGGFELPFGLWFSVAQLDNHVTLVGVADMGHARGPMLAALTEVAVDRLAAVAAGDEPSDAVAALPDPADDPAAEAPDPSAGQAVELPLDGGEYTWSSGVTLKLTVERVEPWGTTNDFCGDGSCGVANPEDTRLVLKYEVTVPEDHAGPFDPEMAGCPGQLHSMTGSDDEAFSGVAGSYYRELGGKVFPGATKFGVAEYYIEKAYADEEFYIESSCGDADYTGETAYFVGPIEDVA